MDVADIIKDYNYNRYKSGFNKKRQRELLCAKPKKKISSYSWAERYLLGILIVIFVAGMLSFCIVVSLCVHGGA